MTLAKMRRHLKRDFPNLIVAGMEPLPFGSIPLPPEQEAPVLKKIQDSRAGIVFVSLGCPKQELWMAQHREDIQAVMVGIGGVFPVYAGLHKRAPRVIREIGLEWLYRLLQEPRRLWKRYYRTIPPFLWMAAKQLWQAARHPGHSVELVEGSAFVESQSPLEQLTSGNRK
ncbi:MAG: hypothetical protein B0A82_02305 [Alkalinema sp. CACIAM 70d]|nr:MAG: hypothetical protein B0A82_02305 [Alkalinema sp. CACIAM 70d]